MSARSYFALSFAQSIAAERSFQHAKWGKQRHSWPEWLVVLMEEVGEASEAINTLVWHAGEGWELRTQQLELRSELVQVAAVVAQIIEHLDEEIGRGDSASS